MRILIPSVLILSLATTASAQDKDPHAAIRGTLRAYEITAQAGPYAILVTSYNGAPAAGLAIELVEELRTQYKQHAYLFSRSDVLRKEETARLEGQKAQRWQLYNQMGLEPPEYAHVKRHSTIEDLFAVLIADPSFKDIDVTKKTLDALRKAKAPSNRLMHKKWFVGPGGPKGDVAEMKTAYENPFQTAFVVPNPAAPKQKAATAAPEDQVSFRDLNSRESYSAVHNIPGKWTLVVRVYRGATMIVPQKTEKSLVERLLPRGPQGGNLLSANEKAAHQLAEILRGSQLNFESYVLHTNNLSLVTVGAFESKDDPRMAAMMNSIGKLRLEPVETLEKSPLPFLVPAK